MPVTLSDIAQRLNISSQSVSIALNERPSNTRISPVLRERIQRTAAEMGYRPHLIARALTKRQTNLFTVTCSVMRYTLYSEAIMAVEDEVRAAGYVMCALHPEEDNLLAGNLVYQISDAVLHLSNYDIPLPAIDIPGPNIEDVLQTPCVIVTPSQPPALPIPYYSCDIAQGSEAIAQHLRDLGHQRAIILAGAMYQDPPRQPMRVANTLQKLDEVGIEGLTVWSETENDPVQRGSELMERVLTLYPGVTAVIGRNDHLTLGAYLWCLRKGIAIPEQISLISHGDSALMASVTPRITSVHTPVRDAAVQAVRDLIARVRNGMPLEPSKTWPCTLTVRESTGPAA